MSVCSTFTDLSICMLCCPCASIRSPSGKIRLSILKLRIGASYLNHPFSSITHSLAFGGSHKPPGRNQPWIDTSSISMERAVALKTLPLFWLNESMSAFGWAGYGCVCEKGRRASYFSKWSDATIGVNPQAVACERDMDDEERILGDSCCF